MAGPPPDARRTGGNSSSDVYVGTDGTTYLVNRATGQIYSTQAPGQTNEFSLKKDVINPIVGAASPVQADLSGVKEAQANAFGLQNQLGAERAGYGGYYNPGMDRSLAGQQQMNINDLANAAAGRVASPAELQLQQQAARNAANAYGLSAAIQGRSPGSALRAAQQGAFMTQADANSQAAIMRAKEQEAARSALTQALQGSRGQNQNLLGADTDWRKALLSGQVGALGAGTTAAGNAANASATNAASQNAYKGSIIGGAGALLGGIL